MNSVLAGQLRAVIAATGGVVAGTGATDGSLEQAVGGIVMALVSALWSWWSKRQAA